MLPQIVYRYRTITASSLYHRSVITAPLQRGELAAARGQQERNDDGRVIMMVKCVCGDGTVMVQSWQQGVLVQCVVILGRAIPFDYEIVCVFSVQRC